MICSLGLPVESDPHAVVHPEYLACHRLDIFGVSRNCRRESDALAHSLRGFRVLVCFCRVVCVVLSGFCFHETLGSCTRSHRLKGSTHPSPRLSVAGAARARSSAGALFSSGSAHEEAVSPLRATSRTHRSALGRPGKATAHAVEHDLQGQLPVGCVSANRCDKIRLLPINPPAKKTPIVGLAAGHGTAVLDGRYRRGNDPGRER